MQLRLSRYHVATPAFLDGADQITKRVVYATRTAEVRVLDDAAWLQIERGELAALPGDLVDDLAGAELLVPTAEDELATVLARNAAAAARMDALAVVIQPTAQCQLGCGYCGQAHSPRWVSAAHQDAFVERTRAKLATGRFQRLDVSWFGAEPLAGIGVMRALSPRLRALAESHGCAYSASITTNGYALSEDMATELVHVHQIRAIHVTLDGPAELHDARRHLKSGRPTFDRIFGNVLALARREDLAGAVEIKIRVNVDRHNRDGVSRLLQLLAEAGVQRRIQLYVAPIHSWGNDAQREALDPAEMARQEIRWMCEMLELGYRPGFIPPKKPVVCLAVQPEGELLDAEGNLFNCTEVSYVPAYGTPNRFAIGHVTTGDEPAKRRLLATFNDRVAEGAYPCTGCRMLPVCGGACPKAWMEGHEPCPLAKRNIEARLLLAYATSRPAAAGGSPS